MIAGQDLNKEIKLLSECEIKPVTFRLQIYSSQTSLSLQHRILGYCKTIQPPSPANLTIKNAKKTHLTFNELHIIHRYLRLPFISISTSYQVIDTFPINSRITSTLLQKLSRTHTPETNQAAQNRMVQISLSPEPIKTKPMLRSATAGLTP